MLPLLAAEIWDLREGYQLYTIHGHKSGVRGVSFSPSGSLFASAGEDQLVMTWQTNFDSLLANHGSILATVSSSSSVASDLVCSLL